MFSGSKSTPCAISPAPAQVGADATVQPISESSVRDCKNLIKKRGH
jgi:hypothetical protein